MSDPQILTIIAIVAFGPLVLVSIHYYKRRNASKVAFVGAFTWAVLYFMIAAPGAKSGRPDAQKNTCIANMKQIAEAKRSWATQTKPETSTAPQISDLAAYLKQGLLPVCPGGGTYTLGAVNEPPSCSRADKGHSLDAALPKASP